MKRKIFFRQSGLYLFDVFIIFITFSWCVFGVVYCSISVFIKMKKHLIITSLYSEEWQVFYCLGLNC